MCVSLCNLNEDETVYNFMARCPILFTIRNYAFDKRELNFDEFRHYVNVRD